MKNVSHPTSHKSLNFQKIRNLNNEVSDTELCYLRIYVLKYMLKYWFDMLEYDVTISPKYQVLEDFINMANHCLICMLLFQTDLGYHNNLSFIHCG